MDKTTRSLENLQELLTQWAWRSLTLAPRREGQWRRRAPPSKCASHTPWGRDLSHLASNTIGAPRRSLRTVRKVWESKRRRASVGGKKRQVAAPQPPDERTLAWPEGGRRESERCNSAAATRAPGARKAPSVPSRCGGRSSSSPKASRSWQLDRGREGFSPARRDIKGPNSPGAHLCSARQQSVFSAPRSEVVVRKQSGSAGKAEAKEVAASWREDHLDKGAQ